MLLQSVLGFFSAFHSRRHLPACCCGERGMGQIFNEHQGHWTLYIRLNTNWPEVGGEKWTVGTICQPLRFCELAINLLQFTAFRNIIRLCNVKLFFFSHLIVIKTCSSLRWTVANRIPNQAPEKRLLIRLLQWVLYNLDRIQSWEGLASLCFSHLLCMQLFVPGLVLWEDGTLDSFVIFCFLSFRKTLVKIEESKAVVV